jgi:muramidase (phage lysozyme)
MADDFDFPDDFDIDDDGSGDLGDGREPVNSTAGNIKTTFISKITGEGNTIKDKAMNNALDAIDRGIPALAGDERGGEIKDAISDVRSEIDNAKDEMVKGTEPLLKTIKEIAPNDGIISKITDKFASLIGADIEKKRGSSGPNEDKLIADSISGTMGDFTDRLEESNTKLAALTASITDENLKKINETIINGNVTQLQAISMNNKFYRESLRLGFKQLYELKSINKNQAEIAKDMVKKLDAVIHNTALPDGLKMQTTEAIAMQMKMSAGESLYNNIFSGNNWVDDVKRNTKRKLSNITSAVLDGIGMGQMGADAIVDINDMNDPEMLAMMSPAERAVATKEGMATTMATERVRGGLLGMAANKLSKTKLGKKVRYHSDKFFSNPYDTLKHKANTSDSDFASGTYNFLASLFKTETGNYDTKAYEDKKNLSGLATFDNRTYETINKVLPEYLSLQLLELKKLNGDKNAKQQKYYYLESKMMTNDDALSNLKTDLTDKYKEDNVNVKFRSVVNGLEALSGEKLTTDEKRKFVESMAKYDGKISIDHIDTQINKEDGLFSDLSAEEKKKFSTIIKKAGETEFETTDENGKKVKAIDSERRYEADSLLSAFNASKLESTKKITSLIEDGFADNLIGSGIVTYDKRTRVYSIDWDNYKKFNVDAMLDAYDDTEVVITNEDRERANISNESRVVKDQFEEKLSKYYKSTKDFVKDKKLDVYFKDKIGIVKGEVSSLVSKLDKNLSQYEKYNIAVGYIEKKYDVAKKEYQRLEGELRATKDDVEAKGIKAKLEILKTTITDIAKEKTHYESLKQKAEVAKEYIKENDVYTFEKDVINTSKTLYEKGGELAKDKELDLLFEDIKKLGKFSKDKGQAVYKSLKGKVEDTEAYQTVESFYTTKIKVLVDEEEKLQKLIDSIPDSKRKKKYLKKLNELRKSTEKLVKERNKKLKSFTFKDAKERIASGVDAMKDLKYSDIKNGTADLTGKVGSKYQEEKKKEGSFINRVVSGVSDALKKKDKVAGDNDGDGDRDGGWLDRLSSFGKGDKDKKSKDATPVTKNEKSGSWLIRLLGSAFTLIPKTLGVLSETVMSSGRVLKTMGMGLAALVGFFTKGGLLKAIGMGLKKPITWLSKTLGMTITSSTGILAQILGGMVSLLGFKTLGGKISGAGRSINNKTMKPGLLKSAINLIAKNKGKLAIGALLTYMMSGTDANAGELEPTLVDEMVEASYAPDTEVDDYEASLTGTQEQDSLTDEDVSMTDVAMMAGGAYGAKKAYDYGSSIKRRSNARKRLERIKATPQKTETAIKEEIEKESKKIKDTEIKKQKTALKADVVKVEKAEKGMWSWLTKRIPKSATKVMKRIPGVGTAINLGLAAKNIASGDYAKAGLNVLSSVVSMIPVIGLAGSFAVDAYATTLPSASGTPTEAVAKEKVESTHTPGTNRASGATQVAPHMMTKMNSEYGKTTKEPDREKVKEVQDEKIGTWNPNISLDQIRTEKPTLPSPQHITKGDRYLLESISQYESGKGDKGYDIINNEQVLGAKEKLKPTSMTLTEIFILQKALVKKGKSGAIGKYQFIPVTLKEVYKKAGVRESDLFNSKTQDKLIIKRLMITRKYREWKEGIISDRHFVYLLSKEFASIENPGTGKTYYTKTNNVAHNSYDNMKQVLKRVRALDKLPDSGIVDEVDEQKNKKKEEGGGSGNGLISSVKDAIKGAIDFFFGSSADKNTREYFEKTELEGDAEESRPGSKYKERASGGTIEVSLPKETIVDKDLCGLTIKKMPPIKKAVEKAGNLHFNGDPKYLIIHNTAGSNLYFGRMKSDGYGTQLWIDKDGTIFLVGDITSVVYHVGKRRPEYHEVSSLVSIGIEMVCNHSKEKGWDPYTDKQKESLLKVGACLMKNFNITPDRVLWHALVSYKTKDEGKEGVMLLRGSNIAPTAHIDKMKSDNVGTPPRQSVSTPRLMSDKRPTNPQVEREGAEKETVVQTLVKKTTVAKQEALKEDKEKIVATKKPMTEVHTGSMSLNIGKLEKLAIERNEILTSIDANIKTLANNQGAKQAEKKKISLPETQPPMSTSRRR